MTDLNQLGDDLHFVRQAVQRKQQPLPMGARFFYYYWAAYVLIGYYLIDVAPHYANGFFMFGGFGGGMVSWFLGRYLSKKLGEVDRAHTRRAGLHWAGGMILAVASAIALAAVIPSLRGPAGSQVLVVMIGLVYYFWGVYIDRNFLWLGPVLILGGITVRFIPFYPWTCLGAVIAAGLVIPTFFPPHRPFESQPQS